MTDHNHTTAALAPPGECPACDEKYEADPKLKPPELNYAEFRGGHPRSGFIGPPEQAKAEAAKLIEQGCLAWVVPEYGNDMGHENVYWGHRVYFFEAEERGAPNQGGPGPIDQEIKEELYLITLALESLVSTINKIASFQGEGEETRLMMLRVLETGRMSARQILDD